jgi:hypothetical protein
VLGKNKKVFISREHPSKPSTVKKAANDKKEEEEEGVCLDSREVELLEGNDEDEKDEVFVEAEYFELKGVVKK